MAISDTVLSVQLGALTFGLLCLLSGSPQAAHSCSSCLGWGPGTC
jgi:hypothetical protein